MHRSALVAAGCSESTTREDVADARADVQEEKNDVAQAQADAQADIAAQQDDDAAVLKKVRLYMDSGATGVMFGRNMWLRPFDRAVSLTRQVHRIMASYPA